MDPITLGGVGAGIAAAAPVVYKAISKFGGAVLRKLDQIEDRMEREHAAVGVKLDELSEDVGELKVDVAVVQTEIKHIKERA